MCSGCFELCTILCSKAILPWWIVSSSRLSLEVSPLGDCNRVKQLSSTVQKLVQSSLCRRTIFTEPSPLGCFFRYSRYAGRERLSRLFYCCLRRPMGQYCRLEIRFRRFHFDMKILDKNIGIGNGLDRFNSETHSTSCPLNRRLPNRRSTNRAHRLL